mgnify:CR=1 FL=1
MAHLYEQRQKAWRGPVVTVALFALLIALALFVVTALGGQNDAREMNLLRQSLRRASITCFAVEGCYPPNVEYMETHYGLVVNHDQYAVFYDVFSANIMPVITVVRRGSP